MKTLRTILNRTGYTLVNVWLVYHLFAIFIAPAGMPPSSPLLVDVSRAALPYNQLLFLNHGYHYFAPDPGPSTLMSFEGLRPGDVAVKGTFPDITMEPRLLYHRYFMLAENIGAFPKETQRQIYTAYARHFGKVHGADTIRMSRLSHDPSSIARIQAGGDLSDPETFFEEPIGFFDFATSVEPPGTTDTAQLDF